MTGRLFTMTEDSRRFICVEKGLGSQFLTAITEQGVDLVAVDRTGPGSLNDCFEVLADPEGTLDAACDQWLDRTSQQHAGSQA